MSDVYLEDLIDEEMHPSTLTRLRLARAATQLEQVMHASATRPAALQR